MMPDFEIPTVVEGGVIGPAVDEPGGNQASIRNVLAHVKILYPERGARINLFCEGGYRLYLIFRPTGDEPGADEFDQQTSTGIAYASIEQYAYYTDLLLSPLVRVTFNPTSASFVVFANG